MWLEALLADRSLAGALALLLALGLDKALGEPSRGHPLVVFGNLAQYIERRCRAMVCLSEKQQGALAWSFAVLPPVLLCFGACHWLLVRSPLAWFVASSLILYLSMGGRSLSEHAQQIYRPLQQGDMAQARYQLAQIVSRDTERMDATAISSSTIESVLENGNDAVIAPMLWFVLLGAPGALLFRLANTLDAMWGYKTSQYLEFGYVSARLDDLLAWLPARLTALSYAVQGDFKLALQCWLQQARHCASPNGGVTMTSGAGALGISIGGPTYYHGVLHQKPPMGHGPLSPLQAIPRAIALVERGCIGLALVWLIWLLAC
ncbi:adenosylcobinamide-phosphate synthase CbiB [Agarivorans sp. Z349TD_8]|uniref:adenosylcobinamide-phosphate synthase CbiB n=1 Tax=Agarivorans sp. Z349TD_8 TaxID=3421434 RepID=UPI003D7E40C4